jgi:hypothetical protein
MSERNDGQVTSLSGLIAQTQYQAGGDPGSVTPTPPTPGVSPASDIAGQGPANEGSSPAAADIAHTGQPAQSYPGLTPQDGGQGIPNGQSTMPNDQDGRVRQYEEIAQNQSQVIETLTQQLQRQQAAQEAAVARTQEQQFLASIRDLPDEERRARVAERKAWIAEQKLLGATHREQQLQARRQMDAKEYIAKETAVSAGLPMEMFTALMDAPDPKVMEQKAQRLRQELGGYGYNPDLPTQPQQVAEIADRASQYTSAMQTWQEAPAELPPATGLSGAAQGTMPEMPANGSGDLRSLIRGTEYTIVQ